MWKLQTGGEKKTKTLPVMAWVDWKLGSLGDVVVKKSKQLTQPAVDCFALLCSGEQPHEEFPAPTLKYKWQVTVLVSFQSHFTLNWVALWLQARPECFPVLSQHCSEVALHFALPSRGARAAHRELLCCTEHSGKRGNKRNSRLPWKEQNTRGVCLVF